MSCNLELVILSDLKGVSTSQVFSIFVSTHFHCIPLIVQLYVNCMLIFATVHLFVNQLCQLYVMKFEFTHSGFITLHYWT